MYKQITKEAIVQTYEKIKGLIHRTPIMKSETINQMCGCEVFFKCENL